MKREELVKRLMSIFVDELDEHVATWQAALDALRGQPPVPERQQVLDTLFRTAHSLKGAARSVELAPIETACHGIETLLSQVRADARELDAPLVALLDDTVAALADAGHALRAGRPLDGRPIAALAERLLDPERALEPGAAPERRPPTALPEPDPESAPRSSSGDPHTSTRLPAVAAPGIDSPQVGAIRVRAERLDVLAALGRELRSAHSACAAMRDRGVTLRQRITDAQRLWRPVHTSVAHAARLAEHQSSAMRLEGQPAPNDIALRLPRRRVDALLGHRDVLGQLEAELDGLARALRADVERLDQVIDALDTELHALRVVPFAEACAGLERAVRELANSQRKRVELVLGGHGVEIDRTIAEAIRDPLLHLVRNAVAHGIEPPPAREAAGKPAVGTVRVAARQQGSRVEIVVDDDGRGVDLEALGRQARARGLIVDADPSALLAVAFEPGISTAAEVTTVAGRGFGLDIVRARLEGLHASVALDSTPGRGTRFTIVAPLTTSVIEVLLVAVGAAQFAVPLAPLARLVEVDRGQLQRVGGHESLVLDGESMPVVSLSDVLGVPGDAPGAEGPRTRCPGLVLRSRERRVVVVVDALLDGRQVAVSSLGPRLRHVRHVAAATILADGTIVPILHVGELVSSAGQLARAGEARSVLHTPTVQATRRLLVADDSLTTRSMMRAILEDAGYQVVVASDGEEAWQLLRAGQQPFDLVVSDVEMPRVDGFELTRRIRASGSLRELPVILVTGLESDAQRHQGLEAGANAYVTKSTFEQSRLLELIELHL